jgi:hypothetical protein
MIMMMMMMMLMLMNSSLQPRISLLQSVQMRNRQPAQASQLAQPALTA